MHLLKVRIDSKEELGDVLPCIMIIILSSISLGMPVTIHRDWVMLKTAKVVAFLTGQAKVVTGNQNSGMAREELEGLRLCQQS